LNLLKNDDDNLRLGRDEKETFLNDYAMHAGNLNAIKERLVTMSPILSQVYSEFPN